MKNDVYGIHKTADLLGTALLEFDKALSSFQSDKTINILSITHNVYKAGSDFHVTAYIVAEKVETDEN